MVGNFVPISENWLRFDITENAKKIADLLSKQTYKQCYTYIQCE